MDGRKEGVATFLEAALREKRALTEVVCLGFAGGLLSELAVFFVYFFEAGLFLGAARSQSPSCISFLYPSAGL